MAGGVVAHGSARERWPELWHAEVGSGAWVNNKWWHKPWLVSVVAGGGKRHVGVAGACVHGRAALRVGVRVAYVLVVGEAPAELRLAAASRAAPCTPSRGA